MKQLEESSMDVMELSNNKGWIKLTPDYQELAMKIVSGKLRNKTKGSTFSMQCS